MISRDEVRQALTGPMMSLSTPFLISGDIDFDGVRRILDFTIEDGGSKAIIMTVGDSLYTLLSEDEISELTRVVVQHVNGRAMVVASDNFWATRHTIQFAQYARDLGADMLMVRPPDWANSCTVDTVVEHYAAVAAEGRIPLMTVTNFLIPRPPSFSMQVLSRLRDEVDGIYAVKDDMLGEFARRLSLLVHDRWAVFTSGTKRDVLNAAPYGLDGYMSNFILFNPEVAHAFFRAVQANDSVAMRMIIRDHDIPLWEFLADCEGSADAALHGLLELKGLAQRWRRKPYHSLNNEQMDQLSDLCHTKGWI